MGDLTTVGYKTEQWAGGQPKATWYDKYGRSFVLPADPYSVEHYQDRGLSLHPPESPVSLVEETDRSEGSIGATRGGIVRPTETGEPKRKVRGPDKKPRKRRKSKRNRA